MPDFDLATFVDEVTNDLVLNAPERVRDMVYEDPVFRAETLGLLEDVRENLRHVIDGALPVALLETILRERKTGLVKAAASHHKTVEELARGAIDRVLTKARELAPKKEAAHG